MKLISKFQLAALSKAELHGLYRQVFSALIQSEAYSQERTNALASLENISREIAARNLE